MNVPFEFFVAVAKLDMPEAGIVVSETSDKAKVLVLGQKLGSTMHAVMFNYVVVPSS